MAGAYTSFAAPWLLLYFLRHDLYLASTTPYKHSCFI